MFDLVDSVGRKLFESISITLVCGTLFPTHPFPLTVHVNLYTILMADECMKTEHPELCTHKLNEMPRWLSSNKMETVKALLSDDPAMLCDTHICTRCNSKNCTQLTTLYASPLPVRSLRESMGVCADGSNKAFPSKDVDAFLGRKRMDIPIDIMEVNSNQNTNHFVLAVDPAGGGSSAFAVCSMIQLPAGQIVVRLRPLASFPKAPPPTSPQELGLARRKCPVPDTNASKNEGAQREAPCCENPLRMWAAHCRLAACAPVQQNTALAPFPVRVQKEEQHGGTRRRPLWLENREFYRIPSVPACMLPSLRTP